jgi:two-component system cell cycle response regulator CpdR
MARILLAEDDTSMREYLQRALQRVGYEVEAVGCGTEAMPLLQASRFDLLLTDIVMPGGMTGYQLADELRARNREVKVLFTSGYTELARADDQPNRKIPLLSKPYRKQDLARAVRGALDQPAGAEALG